MSEDADLRESTVESPTELRLLLLVFSATGNTRYVAGYLERAFESLPLAVEIQSIERVAPENVTGFDVLGFGFPVFEGDSPRLVREYIARLADGEGRGAFVFCTKGAVAGNAERKNLKRLKARGYVGLGGMSVVMPGTDGAAFLKKDGRFARWAQNKDFDQLKTVDRFAARLGGTLAALARGEAASDHAVMVPLSLLGVLIDPIWAAAYGLFGTYMKTRFRADERCNHCGLCARLCPQGNVTSTDEATTFGDACVICMRCIHHCPTEAIQIGKATVDKFRYKGPRGRFKPVRMRPRRERKERRSREVAEEADEGDTPVARAPRRR